MLFNASIYLENDGLYKEKMKANSHIKDNEIIEYKGKQNI